MAGNVVAALCSEAKIEKAEATGALLTKHQMSKSHFQANKCKVV